MIVVEETLGYFVSRSISGKTFKDPIPPLQLGPHTSPTQLFLSSQALQPKMATEQVEVGLPWGERNQGLSLGRGIL